MAEGTYVRRPDDPPPLSRGPRAATRRHPLAAFLVLAFAITGVLDVVPMPDAVHGPLENILGAAVPAVIVTAVAGGRAGLRDLARRSLRWRVGLRWSALALLALPAVRVSAAPPLSGPAPPRPLGEPWPQLFPSFLPPLALLVVFDNVLGGGAGPGFLFARLQARHRPLVAAVLS